MEKLTINSRDISAYTIVLHGEKAEFGFRCHIRTSAARQA